MITRRQFNVTASAALLVPSVSTVGAHAATWPTRAVRIIVPFAAGGPTDVIGRMVGERLSKSWGQQVVIENRPGGGTNIANEVVAHSEPDGHTILMGGQSQATTRALHRSLTYDPIADFAPVAFICGYSFVRAELASGEVGARVRRLCQGKPGQAHARLARHGIITAPLRRAVQAHGRHRDGACAVSWRRSGDERPYSRSRPSPLLRRRHPRQCEIGPSAGSRLHRRAAIAPEVPTIAEDGVPGFNVISWYGFFVPAKTPREIVMKMNADTIAALADPNVQGRLRPLGYESSPDSPERVGAFLKSEVELWTRVVKEAGLAPLD